jgi:signal transduction histidine kinase
MRPTVRLRLTAWYASIFLLGGTVLLAISYMIVSENTSAFPTRVAQKLTAEGGVVAVASGPGEAVPPAKKVLVPADGPFVKPNPAFLLELEKARQEAEQTVGGDLRRETLFDFALALGGTTLISVLAGWLVAGRALRPVGRITATARKVAAEGDLGERIALDGPADELRELADTFDAMLECLDRTFSSQRSFVANASHELRTPLAIIRAEIEERLDDPNVTKAELRAMASVVHEAVGRSEALITSLLILAQGQSALRRQDSVDLGDLARAVVARNEPVAAVRGIGMEPTYERVWCRGDRELLERLVANLVENALRYNHTGGFVRIELSESDHQAVLRVSNSGDHIPAATVEHVFEPFFRVDQSRSRDSGGAGLGLSIVAAVAAAHGGEAVAAAREGGGLVTTVTLPAVSCRAAAAPPRPAAARTATTQRKLQPPALGLRAAFRHQMIDGEGSGLAQ